MNLKADAITRAHQIAVGELKSKWCGDGRKLRDFSTREQRKAITDYICDNPRIVERATAEVASWRLSKITSRAQTRRR